MPVILSSLLSCCYFCCGYVPPLLGRCVVEYVPLSHSGSTRATSLSGTYSPPVQASLWGQGGPPPEVA